MAETAELTMAEIRRLNRRNLKRFCNLGLEQIAVFLPHCLEKTFRQGVKELLKNYNFKKVFIVGGPSQLYKILESDATIKGLIGIACLSEIESAARNISLPKIAIKLQSDGCKKTTVSLTELDGWLKKITGILIIKTPA